MYGSYAATRRSPGVVSKRPDVVLGSSPPLFVGAAAAATAARFRVPWVFDVRDLWPEAALAVGALQGGRAAEAALLAREEALPERRPGRRLEPRLRRPHRRAGRAARGDRGDPERDGEEWVAAADQKVAPAEVGLPEGKFNLVYAGNVGVLQQLDTAIEAFASLGDGYCLTIVGEGPALPDLVEQAASLPEGRVRFVPLLPPEEARRYMLAADALLLSLRDAPPMARSIPIKLYDYSAVGRPILVAASGQAVRITEEEGSALNVAPGDPRRWPTAFAGSRPTPSCAQSISKAARAFGARHIRKNGVAPLDEVLRSLF